MLLVAHPWIGPPNGARFHGEDDSGGFEVTRRQIPLPRRPRLRTALVALAAAALPLTLVGGVSSASGAASPQTFTVLVGSETPNMSVEGMWFLPKDVFIHPGDTVTWKANSFEIHTVTFLAQNQDPSTVMPFNPGNPDDITRQGGDTYDGTSYYNSGLLTTVPDGGDAGPLMPGTTLYPDYSLTFPSAGEFHYLCVVHGMAMQGTVHVLPVDATLPFTQADYDAQAAYQADYLRLDGRQLLRQFRQQADPHHVIVGGDDGMVASMRFVYNRVRIHRGETVTFTNPVVNGNAGRGEPHTVTFGAEKQGPDVMSRYGHPWHFHGGQLSSGALLPGDSFTVRFRKPGTYHYLCVLHDGMGMVGTVVVAPMTR